MSFLCSTLPNVFVSEHSYNSSRTGRKKRHYLPTSCSIKMTEVLSSSRKVGQPSNDVERYKEIIKARPSTVAAREFFADGGTLDWESLPQRCKRLVQVLEAWGSNDNDSIGSSTSKAEQFSCLFSLDPKESRRQAVTAAIMVRADATFERAFYKWFRRSLRRGLVPAA